MQLPAGAKLGIGAHQPKACGSGVAKIPAAILAFSWRRCGISAWLKSGVMAESSVQYQMAYQLKMKIQ
jgi:hypothetical protein